MCTWINCCCADTEINWQEHHRRNYSTWTIFSTIVSHWKGVWWLKIFTEGSKMEYWLAVARRVWRIASVECRLNNFALNQSLWGQSSKQGLLTVSLKLCLSFFILAKDRLEMVSMTNLNQIDLLTLGPSDWDLVNMSWPGQQESGRKVNLLEQPHCAIVRWGGYNSLSSLCSFNSWLPMGKWDVLENQAADESAGLVNLFIQFGQTR